MLSELMWSNLNLMERTSNKAYTILENSKIYLFLRIRMNTKVLAMSPVNRRIKVNSIVAYDMITYYS